MNAIWKAGGYISLVVTPLPAAVAQETETNDLRAEVVVTVSQALGDFEENQPAYWQRLQSERAKIDNQFFCSQTHELGTLSDALIREITQSLRSMLSKGKFITTVNERPAYVSDLFVTAISAFEYGRVFARGEAEGEKLCNPPAANPPPQEAPAN